MDAIDVRDFTFTYEGEGLPTLKHVNLNVEAGAMCLLEGPAGSGKTTLLRCLCPALVPQGNRAGSIKLLGKDFENAIDDFGGEADPAIGDMPKVGLVQQDPDAQMVCDTVWRELAFGLECEGMPRASMRRRVAEAATYFGLNDIFHRKCATLSGGQKQLVNLAAAFALRPSIMLLDEPTAQLDPIAAQRFADVLMRVNEDLGTTIVIATHAPEQFSHIAAQTFSLPMQENPCVQEIKGRVIAQGEEARHGESEQREDEIVSFNNVSFAYERKGRDVVRDLTCNIMKEEILSLVGGNGSGKTTILKLIAGTLKPQRGAVKCAVRDSVAYLPQDSKSMFSKDSVAEELMEWHVGGDYSREDAMRLAGDLGLEDVLCRNPLDLSAGQQQKLAIAKLALCRPRLFLADEPVRGLDAYSQLEIASILEGLRRNGATIVIATHDLEFASKVSDEMALVFDGGLACVEPPKDFCEGNLFYVPKRNGFMRLWEEAIRPL